MLPALLLCLAACGGKEPPSVCGGKLVLIIVDTWRADRLGLYGHERATSPALGAAAEKARVYERAFATSSWTLPSVASLLTGRDPLDHRAGSIALVNGRKPPRVFGSRHIQPLRLGVETVAERMKAAGHATGAFMTSSFLAERFGLGAGFDLYNWAMTYSNHSRPAKRVVHLVLKWLDEHADGPLFCVVHFFDPHTDYDPPPPARGRFTGSHTAASLELPVELKIRRRLDELDDADRAFVRAAYDEELLAIDVQLGRLIEGLRDRGILDDGVVVLTSDHGEELMEHGGFEHGHAMWQELLRVPLLVWGRGVIPGRETAPVSLVDVAPTLLEAAALDPIEGAAGRSLWRNMTLGEALAPRPISASGTLYGPRRRSRIEWPYKLVQSVENETIELYDLESDPGERRDLAAEEPQRAADMLARLLEQVPVGASEAGATPAPELDPETERSLRELGYVE